MYNSHTFICVVLLVAFHITESTIASLTVDSAHGGVSFYCESDDPVDVYLDGPDGITAITCSARDNCIVNDERFSLVTNKTNLFQFCMKNATKQDTGLWTCRQNASSKTVYLTIGSSETENVTTPSSQKSTSSVNLGLPNLLLLLVYVFTASSMY